MLDDYHYEINEEPSVIPLISKIGQNYIITGFDRQFSTYDICS